MNYIQPFIQQLLISFYQLTNFKVGNYGLADAASSFQTNVIDSEFIFVLKIVAGVVSVILIIWSLVLADKARQFRQQMAMMQQTAPSEPAEGGPMQNRWSEIMRHIDSPREGEWKYAIIEADKLVDDLLKNYFPGETMGERLMNIDKTRLLTIDGLWEAHKTRNRLAHEVNYFLRHAEALRAIRLYQETLKELEAIQ